MNIIKHASIITNKGTQISGKILEWGKEAFGSYWAIIETGELGEKIVHVNMGLIELFMIEEKSVPIMDNKEELEEGIVEGLGDGKLTEAPSITPIKNKLPKKPLFNKFSKKTHSLDIEEYNDLYENSQEYVDEVSRLRKMLKPKEERVEDEDLASKSLEELLLMKKESEREAVKKIMRKSDLRQIGDYYELPSFKKRS